MREIKPDVPVILITYSGLDSWLSGQRTAEAVGAFDGVLYKEEHLRCGKEYTRNFLRSLAEGYQVLRNITDHTIPKLMEILVIDDAGEQYARLAAPPRQPWTAFEAANWLRNTLLKFPGVLYDSIHAATSLGISSESFERHDVQAIIQEARYGGIFHTDTARWWRHGLFDVVNRLSEGTEYSPAAKDTFRILASEKVGYTLEFAADVEDKSTLADSVCYVLMEPTSIAYSLPYRPDNRPRVMDEARVSFKAIRETDRVDPDYLDPASRDIFEQIREQSFES